MGLITRLVSPLEGEIKLPVHQLTAALAELYRPEASVTRQDIINHFNLTASEQTTLNNWLDNIELNGKTPDQIRTIAEDVCELGEVGFYDVATVTSRLNTI